MKETGEMTKQPQQVKQKADRLMLQVSHRWKPKNEQGSDKGGSKLRLGTSLFPDVTLHPPGHKNPHLLMMGLGQD